MLVSIAIVAILCAPIGAQKTGERLPARPNLLIGVDTNDWRSYFDFGMGAIHRRPALASNAFYWATRLNPASAEAFYARWVAEWKTEQKLLRTYLLGAPNAVNSRTALRIDSLHSQALRRNPLVSQSLWVTLLDDLAEGIEERRIGSEVVETPAMPMPAGERSPPPYSALARAYRAYNAGQFQVALSQYDLLLQENPARYPEVRFHRALVLHALQQHDSAVADLTLLVEQMRRNGEKRLVYPYRTREIFQYALGLLHARAGRTDKAREVFGDALADNRFFSPAHSALGILALAAGDTAAAAGEFGLAAQLEPEDATLRHDYGGVLFSARQYDDAVAELREAIRLEPYFASSYLLLARALDKQGKTQDALEQYASYLARAPRSQSRQADWVTARLAQIQNPAREE